MQTEFNKYKNAADFVASKTIHERTRDLSVRDGKPDSFSEFDDSGLLIEVMRNGHMGYSATCETTPDGIKLAFEKAIAMTESSSRFPVFKFDSRIRPASKGTYSSASQKKLDSLSTAEI